MTLRILFALAVVLGLFFLAADERKRDGGLR